MFNKPSLNDRISKWNSLYIEQGQRWDLIPSLAAHLSLPQIYRTTQNQNKSNLLDIGCGYGRDLMFFKRIFHTLNLEGLDSSYSAIKIARQFLHYFTARNLYEKDFIEFSLKKKYDIIFGNYNK